MSALNISLQCYIGGLSQCNNGRRKNTTLAGKEEVKLTLFVDDTVTYESTC